jgi:hypothetical protein
LIIETLKSTGMAFYGLYVGNICFPKRFIQEALNEESYDVRDAEVVTSGNADHVILWFHTKAYWTSARPAFIQWQPVGNHVRLKAYPANKQPPAGLVAREVPKIEAKVKMIQVNLTDLVSAWDHDRNLPNKVFAAPTWKTAQNAEKTEKKIASETELNREVDEAFQVAAGSARTETEIDGKAKAEIDQLFGVPTHGYRTRAKGSPSQ